MSLRSIGTVELPPHRGVGGFDHASVDRAADRLFVAHTANDFVEVVDLDRRTHERSRGTSPGIAGAAVDGRRRLLVATCRREAHVALARLDEASPARRVSWGEASLPASHAAAVYAEH